MVFLAEIFNVVHLVRDLLVRKSRSCVSRFWKPNNGVESAIAEFDINAEAEGNEETLRVYILPSDQQQKLQFHPSR